MKGMTRATAMRRTAVYAALTAALCLPADWVAAQRAQQAPAPKRTPPPRQQAPRQEAPRSPAPRGQERSQEHGRSQQQLRPLVQDGRSNFVPTRPNNAPMGQAPGQQRFFQPQTHPATPQGVPGRTTVAPSNVPQNQQRPVYPGPPYIGPGTPRPSYPGYRTPIQAPPGHLQSWLDQHRNVPVQNQEQLLRSDPSFKELPPGEQHRLVQQLLDVNQMPDRVRQRRLARAEMMERLTPEDRMQVSRSAKEWTTLPEDRQVMMKSAFRDLRSVPPDQRSIVLNSARYQGQFTPQERGILGNMLRVEPYEPPR